MQTVKAAIEKYVRHINEHIYSIPRRGPSSKYELPDEGLTGQIQLEWLGDGIEGFFSFFLLQLKK